MDVSSLIEMKPNPKIAIFAPGDTVKVRAKIVEGDKERIQVFQGVVIRIRHGGAGATFTVRRVSYGVGVERTFPFHSPMVDGVEVVRHGKVRRAKLYYLRGLSTKASRIKEKRLTEKEKEELAQAQVLAPGAVAEKSEVEAPAQEQTGPESKAQAEEQGQAQEKSPKQS